MYAAKRIVRLRGSLSTALLITVTVSRAQDLPAPYAAAPIGTFQCYVSVKKYHDPDAKRIFKLEIADAQTYRLVAAQPLPHSRYVTRAMRSNEALDWQFRSGGFLSLQETDGSILMGGFYGTAYDGRPNFLLVLHDRPDALIRCGDGNLLAARRPAPSDAGTAATARGSRLGLPAGAKVGGALAIGRYDCVAQKSKRWSSTENMRFTLGLYANFEYYIDKPDEPVLADDGRFSYDPARGALDISIAYELSSGDADSARQTVFYRDAAGTPAIAAHDDFPTHCRHIGPNTEASLNDKPRYRYATAPGKGLQPGQVEGIAHSYKNQWTISGYQPEQRIYLLLKDGTLMLNPPVPPGEIDVAASKRHDAQAWGVLKRSGKKLLVKLNANDKWTETSASMVMMAKPGERLSGKFEASWSYSVGIGLGGAASFSYLDFKADGSYTKSGYSIGGTGTMQQLNGFSSHGVRSSGPEGSRGSASSSYTGPISQLASAPPDLVAGSQSRENDGDDFIGRYELDGYTLTLRSRSGKVRRHLFFFWDDRRSHFNADDSAYSREK